MCVRTIFFSDCVLGARSLILTNLSQSAVRIVSYALRYSDSYHISYIASFRNFFTPCKAGCSYEWCFCDSSVCSNGLLFISSVILCVHFYFWCEPVCVPG
uniref:Putative secreted protein n=1 Tax=Amblyomma parvum TaxID=251391 RepID=A0A023G271_AMBPA